MLSDLKAIPVWGSWGKGIRETHDAIYEKLEGRIKEEKWVRPFAPYTAVCGALLTVAFRVTVAVEIAMMGLASTFKSFIPFSKERTFMEGVTLLAHVFPREAVHAVYSPIEAVSYAIVTLVNMLFFPIDWVEVCRNNASRAEDIIENVCD